MSDHETCRDVLAELLDRELEAGRNGSPDAIRWEAAIAADDAELARLRRIEDAARAVADTHDDLMSSVSASDERKAVVAHAAAHDALWTLLNASAGARAAQRIAVDGGRDDG